jgi:hypothetical protein
MTEKGVTCLVALSVGSFGYAQDDKGVYGLRLWGPSTPLRFAQDDTGWMGGALLSFHHPTVILSYKGALMP